MLGFRHQSCVPFQGLAGDIVGFMLSVLAVASYVGIFYYQRTVSRKDRRSWTVFNMDLTKICISQSVAWAVNLYATAYNDDMLADSF